jgi:hypothetical protein
MYGPSTCTELNVIDGSFGAAGVFAAVASACRFGGSAPSANVEMNAAQANSKRYLAISVNVKIERVYVADAGDSATSRPLWRWKMATPLLLQRGCAALNP